MINRVYDYIRFRFSIFPGISGFQSARFLQNYYKFRSDNQSVSRVIFNTVFLGIFRLYAYYRSHSTATRWSKSTLWRRWAGTVGARHFVDPNDLAMFEIQTREDLQFLYRRFEHIGCGLFIDEKLAEDNTLFHDKFAFAQFCRERQIPHPDIYAYIHSGQLDRLSNFNDQKSLIAKPTYGTGGKGVFEINIEDAAKMGDEGLRSLLGRMIDTHAQPYILQERIYPSACVADLALDGMPTARVTTVLDEHGEPEIVTSVMRFPSQPDTIADNAHLGGIMSAIDAKTGELSVGRYRSRGGSMAIHPYNSAQIQGRRIANWEMIKKIACDAHRMHLANCIQIGWDFGLAETPVVLEINSRPDLALAQRASNTLIGKSRYGELISHHVSRRIAELQHI